MKGRTGYFKLLASGELFTSCDKDDEGSGGRQDLVQGEQGL